MTKWEVLKDGIRVRILSHKTAGANSLKIKELTEILAIMDKLELGEAVGGDELMDELYEMNRTHEAQLKEESI